MDNFTECYTKARDVVDKQTFSDDWQKFLTSKCGVKNFFGSKGLSKSYSKAPDLLRTRISSDVKPGSITTGDVLYSAADNPKSGGTLADRAATLKMMKHIYRIKESGGQNVWVYSPPKSDSGWVYDEITGIEATIKDRLKREDEIFGADDMKWMSTALSTARKVSEDAKSKLAGGFFFGVKQSTKDMVRRWFLDEDATDDDLATAIATLLAGFKKIAAGCNSSTLLFTDYPDWRAQRDKYYGAAFRGGEGGGFPVIYLEGAFTRLTGNSGKAWLCAQTIVHEMSHHEVSTQDHRYDHNGLKPNKATFPNGKTIENADSWGYFALDLAGYLSTADFNKVWK